MSRWKLVVASLSVLVVVSCGGGGGGSDEKSVTTQTIEDVDLSDVLSSTTSTSTTTTIQVTTTLSAAQTYEALNEEVQRACQEALRTGQPPAPEFDPAWGSVSSPEELAATVADCLAKSTTTTIPGGTPADGGE